MHWASENRIPTNVQHFIYPHLYTFTFIYFAEWKKKRKKKNNKNNMANEPDDLLTDQCLRILNFFIQNNN